MIDSRSPQKTRAQTDDRDWLRSLAAVLVQDDSLADDLAQETWLAAHRRGWAPGKAPRPWLATVLRHLALSELRANKRRTKRERATSMPSASISGDEVALRTECYRSLAEAVSRLSVPNRLVVTMCYLEGLSPLEIAARLEIPSGTVRSRLKRALDRLREEMDRKHRRRQWTLALASSIPGEDKATYAQMSAAWLAALLLIGSSIIFFESILTREKAASPSTLGTMNRETVSLAPRDQAIRREVTTTDTQSLSAEASSGSSESLSGWWLSGTIEGTTIDDSQPAILTVRRGRSPGDLKATITRSPFRLDLSELFLSQEHVGEALSIRVHHPQTLEWTRTIHTTSLQRSEGRRPGHATLFPIDISLTPAYSVVSGKVVPSPGVQATDIQVLLVQKALTGKAVTISQSLCDRQGHYRLKASAPGTYSIIAFSSEEARSLGSDTHPALLRFDIGERGDKSLPTLELHPGRSFRGWVRDLQGRPVLGARLTLRRADGEPLVAGLVTTPHGDVAYRGSIAKTRDDGRFCFPDLTPGDYRLSWSVTRCGSDPSLLPPPIPIRIPTDELVLTWPFRQTRLEIHGTHGPLDTATAEISRSRNSYRWPADDHGRIAVALHEGHNRLTIRGPGHLTQEIEVFSESNFVAPVTIVNLVQGGDRCRLRIDLWGDPHHRLEHAELSLSSNRDEARVESPIRSRRIGDSLIFEDLPRGHFMAQLRPCTSQCEGVEDTFYLSERFTLDLHPEFENRHALTLRLGGRLVLPPFCLDGDDPYLFRLRAPDGTELTPTAFSVEDVDGHRFILRDQVPSPRREWHVDGVLEPGLWRVELYRPGTTPQFFEVQIRPEVSTRLSGP